MAQKIGTYSLADLQGITASGIIDEADVAQALTEETDAHNAVVREEIAELVEYTTERESVYGTQVTGEMKRGDDFAMAPTQKGATTGSVAFPFEKWLYATGWTRDFRRKATPAKFAQVFVGGRRSHIRALQSAIRYAIFGATNYTFNDYMDSKLNLTVRRFLNGDSSPIPEGPNSEIFTASTHTHYLGSASLTTTAATAAIRTLVEHGNGADVRVYINQADESTWTALTGFVKAQPAEIIVASTTARTVQALDTSRIDNRFIGFYEGAKVYTKPWIYANFAYVFDAGSPDKPLALREDLPGSSNLVMEGIVDLNPLTAEQFVARFGIGVKNRTNGVVLNFAAGGATYVEPAGLSL